MDSKSKSPVGIYYETHHIKGTRLQQTFMGDIRGAMFSSWIGTGKVVLDLGGRDGSLTQYYTDSNKVVIGDVDLNALTYAKERYGVETKEVNLNEQLPFEDNSIDVVVMAEVLEHLPYPRFVLGEVKRILRKEGQFIGSIPLAYHLIDRWRVLRGKKLLIADVDPTHLQFFKYDELLSLLSEFFNVQEINILKGGKKADAYPRMFARDVAFRCSKNGDG